MSGCAAWRECQEKQTKICPNFELLEGDIMKLLTIIGLTFVVLVTACGLNEGEKAATKDFFTAGTDTGSPYNSATPSNVSNSSVIYKAAIKAAGQDALEVLKGEEPSDLFLQAKSALENEGMEFKNDQDAAFAIIEAALKEKAEAEAKKEQK